MQHIVFGGADRTDHERIKENILPTTVLASFVLAGVAAPFFPKWAGPLAISQARKPQPVEVSTSEPSQSQHKIARSNTIATASARSRLKESGRVASAPLGGLASSTKSGRSSSLSRANSSQSLRRQPIERARPSRLDLQAVDARLSSSSLPLPENKSPKLPLSPRPRTPKTAGLPPNHSESNSKRHSLLARPLTPSVLSETQKTKLLRQNYFRSQTQFLTALEGISIRLVNVPKPARLSALRAELALIAQDLPAEVDIPVICPPSLVDGIPSRSKHHRIVRLNPAEATVLNSAEKVPYLLMVEILRDDFTFDPNTSDNQRLLSKLLSEQGAGRRRIFDLSESGRLKHSGRQETSSSQDSVFEPVTGDLGSTTLINDVESENQEAAPLAHLPRLSSGATTLSTLDVLTTPRSSGGTPSRSDSPGPSRKSVLPHHSRPGAYEQPDFSALATHMRTASQMLAQLDSTSGKRPKNEVAAIRAKIIASMQSLEEQSFDLEHNTAVPTFDTIIANANVAATNINPEDMEDEAVAGINANAGDARMENDQKTGGIQRKGDRDDPSAATFGEAWLAKKERVRKSSPYGWMPNWDVVSVIVKTGDDLRQEAFACQLIEVCDKIWEDANIPIWLQRMKILVTGESTGLIETITNGVSLHSLKRSLTLATIEAGQNPRRRIATLKDHFVKAFGSPESDAYKAAVEAFKRSLAAYSIISYVLQLKDRHNGNVLIDNEGHIVHIDFGFMLSNSPGSVGFEAAPFKLTQDYVDVLGGVGSPAFDEYKTLCKQAFQGVWSCQVVHGLFANTTSTTTVSRLSHRFCTSDGSGFQNAVLLVWCLTGYTQFTSAFPVANEC